MINEEDDRTEWDWLEDMASLILVFGFCVVVAMCLVAAWMVIR
jgi:hypothetical protein